MSYIERETVLNVVADIMQDCKVSHKHRALNRNIKQIPSVDVVEVVRCKDCKHHRTLKDGGVQCERIDGLLMTLPNDFCSYGERREE